jgi:hypothetical protein
MPPQPAHHLVDLLEVAMAHAHHAGLAAVLDPHVETEDRISRAVI